MQAIAIKTPLIKKGDNLVGIILQKLDEENLRLQNSDILAISSKVLSSAEGNVVELGKITPSLKAKQLSKKYILEPEFVELVLKEAEKIYGGVEKAILTLKDNILTVNAGIDQKNVPKGYVSLWPSNLQDKAEKIRKEIRRRTGKNVGVLIVDSIVAPLRMGTRGLALAAVGFEPVKDCRGRKDLFHKPLLITRHAVADDLASVAHLLMGEADEKSPIILIRDAPVHYVEKVKPEDMKISPKECVFMNALTKKGQF